MKHPPLLPLFNVAWCWERLSSSIWLKLFYNIVLWEREGDTIVQTVFQQSDTDCRIPGRAEASIRATASWSELEDTDGMAVDSTLGNSPGMETGAEDG